MKSLKIILALFLLAGTVISQQVDRDKVIIESATGTW